MTKLRLSPTATALLRVLLARAGVERDRILLSEFRSTDWQSLTFVGERHEIQFQVIGPEPEISARRLAQGLSEAEFSIPGQIVADVVLASLPAKLACGSVQLRMEALTIAE
jgi:hypothetical protein